MYAITLAAAAIIWPFIVALFANKYGADVGARFLERGGNIPSTGQPLDHASLEVWLRLPANGLFLRPYAYLIMPLDLIYACFVGGFLVCGALWLSAALTWPEPLSYFRSVLVCVLPAIYILSDVVEDMLIMRILPRQDVSEVAFAVMRTATKIKVASFGAAVLQIVALGIYAVFTSAA
ncbi:MAG: hypothetical protein WA418_30310 [Bradyrhizobium sp.]